jgi:hypothetical protein
MTEVNKTIHYLSLIAIVTIGLIGGYAICLSQGTPLSQMQQNSLESKCQASINEATTSCTETYESECTIELRLAKDEALRLRKVTSNFSKVFDKMEDSMIDRLTEIEKSIVDLNIGKYAMPEKGMDLNCIKWTDYNINVLKWKSFDMNKWVTGSVPICTKYNIVAGRK